MSLQAALLVDEGFLNYPDPGGVISSIPAAPATGLTGNWVESAGDSDGYVNRSGGTPGAFEMYKSSDATRRFTRSLSDPETLIDLNTTYGGTFYASAVFQTDDAVDGDLAVEFINDSDSGSNSHLVFGISNGSFFAEDATGGTVVANQVYQLVLKVEYDISGSTDRITGWLDPASEASATVFQQTGSYLRGQFDDPGGGFSSVQISGGDLGGFSLGVIDDIRIGASFDDVTAAPSGFVAIPEPSSFALVAVSLLLFGQVMRKRR